MVAENSKSTFVTVLAWIGIAFSGFGTFITIVQNIMLKFLMPKLPIEQLLNEHNTSVQIPEIARFMFQHFLYNHRHSHQLFQHFDLFFLAALLISLFALTASIGLLKRKNWARIAFIAMLAIGIVWNLFSLAFQQTSMQKLPFPLNAPGEFQSQMETMMTVMSIVSVIFGLALTAFYGWIIWKLRSAQIVNEFKSVEHQS